MPRLSDNELSLGRVYATALLNLAESQGEGEWLLKELLDLAGKVEEDADLKAFLSSPMIGPAAREATIEKLFRGRYSDLFVNSLQILSAKGRLSFLAGVAEAYRLAYDELRGRVDVQVRSAATLPADLRTRLVELMSTYTGRQAELMETVDASLLGGMIVQIGDQKFDMSVASKLRNLGEALRNRASREIHKGATFLETSAG